MPQNVRLCVRTPEHRIPNSMYCPPHMIHNAKACSSSSGRQAGSSNRSSSSRQQNDECRYNDTNAMGNVKVSNVNKSHNDRAEGEKSAVVAAAVAKCIDRSAISIYGTRSQHADMSIRITHINSALSFHSFQRSSMARVVVVCLSTCVLKNVYTIFARAVDLFVIFTSVAYRLTNWLGIRDFLEECSPSRAEWALTCQKHHLFIEHE